MSRNASWLWTQRTDHPLIHSPWYFDLQHLSIRNMNEETKNLCTSTNGLFHTKQQMSVIFSTDGTISIREKAKRENSLLLFNQTGRKLEISQKIKTNYLKKKSQEQRERCHEQVSQICKTQTSNIAYCFLMNLCSCPDSTVYFQLNCHQPKCTNKQASHYSTGPDAPHDADKN